MRQQQRGTHHRIPRRSSLDTAYPPHHHRGLGTPGLGAHQRQIGAAAAVGIDSLNGGPKRTRRAASLSHVLHQVQTVYYTIRACLSVCLIFRTSGLCFLLDSPTFIHSFFHTVTAPTEAPSPWPCLPPQADSTTSTIPVGVAPPFGDSTDGSMTVEDRAQVAMMKEALHREVGRRSRIEQLRADGADGRDQGAIESMVPGTPATQKRGGPQMLPPVKVRGKEAGNPPPSLPKALTL